MGTFGIWQEISHDFAQIAFEESTLDLYYYKMNFLNKNLGQLNGSYQNVHNGIQLNFYFLIYVYLILGGGCLIFVTFIEIQFLLLGSFFYWYRTTKVQVGRWGKKRTTKVPLQCES